MTKRESRIKTLMRRIGPMRTMLLVGLIDTMPQRDPDPDFWFTPDHSAIQKVMKVKQPVYWALLGGIMQRGLVTKRHTDQHGHQYQIQFEAIEHYCRLSKLESIVIAWRALLSLRARKNA